MKALTVKGQWYEFTLNDVPCVFEDGHFALLRKPDSPILRLDTIRRGEPSRRLYEGDIIHMGGENWLVSYERGFYLVSESYVIREICKMTDHVTIGSTVSMNFPVDTNFKKKHMFKYNNIRFRIQDIVGTHADGLLVRLSKYAIPIEDVCMDCCMTLNGTHLYLGDKVDNKTVTLCDGKIVLV